MSKEKRAGCAPARAAQGDADILCCHEVLLSHGHLAGHEDPQDLLYRAAFQLAAPSLHGCTGLFPTRVRALYFPGSTS